MTLAAICQLLLLLICLVHQSSSLVAVDHVSLGVALCVPTPCLLILMSLQQVDRNGLVVNSKQVSVAVQLLWLHCFCWLVLLAGTLLKYTPAASNDARPKTNNIVNSTPQQL
jgi:hypothetical protein